MDNDHQCLPCRWHQSTARWGGVNDAACSGGLRGGRSTPLCSWTRCTMMFPNAAVYASRFPYAIHTPVDVTGVEPAATAGCRSGPIPTHPVILFRITGRRIKPGADGRPLSNAWFGGFRGAQPRPSFLNYRDCPVPLHLEQGLDVHAPRPPTP